VGPFAETMNLSARNQSSIMLIASDKDMLRPYRIRGGMTSIAITTGRSGHYGTEW
jgi:hypothetical protein